MRQVARLDRFIRPPGAAFAGATRSSALGRGGMATVYLAQDLRHGRPVAIKVLLPELAAALGPERVLREIQIAARLQHESWESLWSPQAQRGPR